jgi:antitoxin component of MazEF toxin-antitoxin module
MRGKVIRQDGKLVVVIPDDVASREHLQENAEVEIKTVPEANEPTLDELLDRITPDNLHEYVDWGPPVGNEW